MAVTKNKSVYVCQSCGYESVKWYGRCPDCGEWNSLVEEIRQQVAASKTRAASAAPAAPRATAQAARLSEISSDDSQRYKTGVGELDRVLGGGIVAGSVMLLSGDPGIGKSTLLLQICQYLCGSLKILYVSGEESARQLKLRANRLGVDSDNLYISATTDVENVLETVRKLSPDVVMIDSIQTMNLSALTSSAGSVTQIRECTQVLIGIAKSAEIPVFIVGHVNKDGAIAGPKMLEHMVDAVLYFEGERHQNYRILRAVKNRYGSTNEIGVFEMGQEGLHEVPNPSLMMLSGRPKNVSGTCVACVMEGTRPILAEVQALVSKTGFGTPRRQAAGFDYNRAALLIAVLEKRGGYFFGTLDAYINVVGGLRLDEPAADLPVAMALVSNLLDKCIPDDLAAFGEIGLAGEVRSVGSIQQRVSEAYRLGFTTCVIPRHCISMVNVRDMPDLNLIGVQNLSQAIAVIR
ncbi:MULTISPECIES: DNA repair protein RadA [Anaerotruncus]|jgi:DNA repair protein RadA/Sms|uniref:DNA repair protein RadA n=1 Tax=Anaerotruncus colihominis TaxID=169435 RepID=A0A845SW23_9FIRM|nr:MULTISPECIES: DNA repair protein RadA [Anaerotruncus]MCI8491625.1 DNA repair protein RadA [Anaerotruncus sp.]MCR2025769.1 DNA repair protein RadA [Anaerotruncus colihominis]NDO38680.1 DNA repair protein RadA [Anaerotruncus colihominis]